MKISDIAARVRTQGGDEAGVLYSDVLLAQWINDGMRECVVDNMLKQKTGTVASVVGTNEYDLPTDILKLYRVRYDNVALPVLTIEEFDELVTTDGSDRGTPSNVVVWAGKLRFYPTPDTIKSIKIEYSTFPTEVGITGTAFTNAALELDLPVLYHRRIVDYCLAMIAEQDDDMQRYELKMQEFRTGVQNLKDHPESTHDSYPSISVSDRDMGEGWYDY